MSIYKCKVRLLLLGMKKRHVTIMVLHLHDEILNDIRSHVDIKACIKWQQMKCLPLLIPWKAIFVLHRCPRICLVCGGMKIQVQWVIPFLHARFSPWVLSRRVCSACPFFIPRRRSLTLHLYIFIYITHYTHYLDHLT